jgi:hypothetical protein
MTEANNIIYYIKIAYLCLKCNFFSLMIHAERSMIQPKHVDKGKLNKCILKASVDTIFCWTQSIAGHNSVLDTVI